ncbi:MAG: glutamyl-tRNA reductase [Candidatus Omnitrophica bacterium]|nr:glutamyl-tRNA reductase [Candidatus Omnitrophota bacterium]
MFIVVGTNYKYCPIERREKLSIPKGKLKSALAGLADNKDIKGAVILSTCNRVETYLDIYGNNSKREIASEPSAPRNDNYTYIYKGREAITHLFEVACGLDSQIIGEGQILSQVEFAWREAKRFGSANPLMDVIFDRVIKTAFKVRENTRISAGDISLASIVLNFIKMEYGGIKDKNILLIGVGKISELMVRYLKEEDANAVFIANKTYEKAKRLADSINAEVVRFDMLKDKLREADIIISATSSPHFILRKEDLVLAIDHRLSTHRHPILIFDLAVPRDIDPAINGLPGIELFNLDGLGMATDSGLERRKREIPAAWAIIDEEVNELCESVNSEPEPEPALSH